MGNLIASPQATIAALQSIAARADASRQYYINGADPAVREEFNRRQGGAAATAAPSDGNDDLRVGGHYTLDGRRYRIRTQEQLDGIRRRLGGGG
jgi:hypothetical protein